MQFAVDVGVKATNVTRLELFVRQSDAFVGIYPFFLPKTTVDPTQRPRAVPRGIFRLELDSQCAGAVQPSRSSTAGTGTTIAAPPTVRVFRYEHRDILGGMSSRRDDVLSKVVLAFCEEVAGNMRLGAHRADPGEHDRVGIVVPRGNDRGAYSEEQVARLEDRLGQLNLTTVRLDSKRPVDGRFLSDSESLDWAIVDVGPEACAGGLPAFLHGYSSPRCG